MADIFLHMGCDQQIAQEVIGKLSGVRVVDRQYAGLKLEADTDYTHISYFRAYYAAWRLKQEHALIEQIHET